MSRIGKNPVPIPANVQAEVSGQTVKVKGPKGELSVTLPEDVKVEKDGNAVKVSPREDTQRARAMWGLSRTLIANQIKGVVDGYAETLEIHGVGFRAQLKGKDLTLQLGFSHEINYKVPADIDVKIGGPRQDHLMISGIDKQKVGQVAAEIRAYRPPEPYQGKGVRYQGEFILRKEGKKK
jgi:large subunit ribosomal protein L6